ncbi:hypothetical protein [Clostridium akagii]|uniref:hypothetical protein n=1 Tax=Clostridium akagii TaxID=91623 RepID=UPI00047EF180|nr:hypothetical protein [Clostridium akagii]
MLLLLAITSLNSNVYAQSTTSSNINLIITYKNNSIDSNVEKFVTNSGGQVLLEMSELRGATEVKCIPSLIPTIRGNGSIPVTRGKVIYCGTKFKNV